MALQRALWDLFNGSISFTFLNDERSAKFGHSEPVFEFKKNLAFNSKPWLLYKYSNFF